MAKDKIYLSLFSLYFVLSIILGSILRDSLVIFMSFNIFLAFVVYMLSQAIIYTKMQSKNKVWFYIFGILFVIFFPNSMYMLTDLIHLEHYQFINGNFHEYVFLIKPWIVFAHLVIGGVLAAKLGVIAVDNLFNCFKIDLKTKVALLISLFVLSGIAIAIGRFFRFNSWEIYKIGNIIRSLLSEIGFVVGFVLIYTVLQVVVYLLLSNNTNHNKSH